MLVQVSRILEHSIASACPYSAPATATSMALGMRPSGLLDTSGEARLQARKRAARVAVGGGRHTRQQQRVAGGLVLEGHAHDQLGAQRAVRCLRELQVLRPSNQARVS